MRALDVAVLGIIGASFVLALYFLWTMFPSGDFSDFEEYKMVINETTQARSVQTFPNMRYRDKVITYFIEPNCSAKRRNDAQKAFQILQSSSVLQFKEVYDQPEITVTCSRIAPKTNQSNQMVAGEGGPNKLINTTNFWVIISGNVSLFQSDECETPQIALHEIIHALGFEHNNNQSSIMYPVTMCNQVIDSYILEEINRLYSIPSQPDLAIEKISANKTGRELNFNIILSNIGLQDVENSSLVLVAKDSKIRTFDLGLFEVGVTRRFAVTGLKVPQDVEQIEFIVETGSPELSKENNRAVIKSINKTS